LVPLPNHANIVGCKWIFKIKKKWDGTIERYKARMIAKGFTQEEVDFFNTFSPVIKPTTIRIVLTIALSHNCPLHQLDVNNDFLHGDLEETIYMAQPLGFADSVHPNHVCLLKKALYDLKQTPEHGSTNSNHF
jgi:Reverse transcriptase (RNA-dependent DNA polymerase)